MVYVLSKNGQPIMPTNNHGQVRLLLKSGKAKVVKRVPFTIQLIGTSKTYTQEITLGVDTGSKHIGLSVTTKKKVLFEANVELRNDIVELISVRRELRHSRRNRKTRYRKPRFLNRRKSKKEGWLPPSVLQKINTHLIVISKVHKILPISKVIVEVANFDIQKINNHKISGKEYQQGPQWHFRTVNDYVKYRDNNTCQCCQGKSGDNKLEIHHIESRKTGGNAPNNLVTLCKTCHDKYTNGIIKLPSIIKRGKSFRDATFMNIMKYKLLDELGKQYSDVMFTFGYITKIVREALDLPKEHYIDGRCISGNPLAKSDGKVYIIKKIRRHNRQLYKSKTMKGNIRKKNQCPYTVFGFHRYDLVKYKGQLCYINSLRMSGSFMLKILGNKEFTKYSTYKKLQRIQSRGGYLINVKIS